MLEQKKLSVEKWENDGNWSSETKCHSTDISRLFLATNIHEGEKNWGKHCAQCATSELH